MFELDEKFFEEVGLSKLPQEEQESFRAELQEEAHVRIGELISDGMSVEKLEEFEKIADGDMGAINDWILKYAPNYKNDEIYKMIVSDRGGEGLATTSAYAAAKWLQVNRPDFASISAKVINDLKEEVRQNISKIVG